MDTPVGESGTGEGHLGRFLEWLGEVQTGRRVGSDAVVSEPFVREHTAYDTFEEFVEDGPRSLPDPDDVDDVGSFEAVDRDRLDDHVSATTDFETWEEMETRAAEEALLEHHLF
jgi:hypothetical protein